MLASFTYKRCLTSDFQASIDTSSSLSITVMDNIIFIHSPFLFYIFIIIKTGAEGLEPTNGGSKNRSLTTWRRPIYKHFLFSLHQYRLTVIICQTSLINKNSLLTGVPIYMSTPELGTE